MRIEELRATLEEEARNLGGADSIGPQARTAAVLERVRASAARRRTARIAGAGTAALAVLAGFVLQPVWSPDASTVGIAPQQPMVQAPPHLAGWPVPARLTVRGHDYSYLRGEQVDQSREILRVAVAPSNHRQVFGWATSFGSQGRVVVSLDGEVVDRTPTGAFEYGTALPPGETHLVVVRVTEPQAGLKLGLAIYGPVTF